MHQAQDHEKHTLTNISQDDPDITSVLNFCKVTLTLLIKLDSEICGIQFAYTNDFMQHDIEKVMNTKNLRSVELHNLLTNNIFLTYGR